MPRKYLTITEAAALLRLADRTVYAMLRGGRIPGAAKVGGKWRVDRSKLVAHDFTVRLEENADVLNEVLDFNLVSAERDKAAGGFNVDGATRRLRGRC